MKVLVWAFGVAFTNSRRASPALRPAAGSPSQQRFLRRCPSCIGGSHVFVGEQFAGFIARLSLLV